MIMTLPPMKPTLVQHVRLAGAEFIVDCDKLNLETLITVSFQPPKFHGPFDAVGLRGERTGRHVEFGLYGLDGYPVPDSDIDGHLFTSGPAEHCNHDAPEAFVSDPVLFAGLAPPQFGHVILNSLGRLWALDHLPRGVNLLYLPRRRPNISHYPHLLPILGLLGVDAHPILHRGPTRYRALYTATDLFGERHGGAMSPTMRDWFERRLPASESLTKGRRVYVTRSQLGPNVGRYGNEQLLEKLLAEDGYEIFAPEQLSLSEQILVLQDAEYLVFAESSALHLYGLVQRRGQHVAIIQRRKSLPPLIQGQLGDGPAILHTIDVIDSVYWPPERKDNSSVAVLNFERLRENLVTYGFLSSNARWQSPRSAEVAASLHAGLPPGVTLIPDGQRRDWLRIRRNAPGEA
jgi:hypothetical protein